MAVTSPNQPAQTEMDDVLSALEGRIRRGHISIFYQFGLLLVALAMLILPLIYIALIGAVAYVVYLHAVHDLFIFREVRQVHFALMFYAFPIVAGTVLILFMMKPLFAPLGRGMPARALKREDQPLLFEFVERLCKLMNAPRPRRIEVDCNVNASAGMPPGLFRALIGRDLTLCIGLPLVGGLNLRQFAGVLAHEFGHFGQGFAMRLSFIINFINHWFARVVYERDAWDQALNTAASEGDIRIRLVIYGTMFMVWLSRRVLWVLMMFGHTISCFMSRQMEYDADRHAAGVVGSQGIGDALMRLTPLTIAERKSLNDLGQAWEEKRLGDNLPALIDNNFEQMPENLLETIREAMAKERAGVFSTHPSTRMRLRRLEKINDDGFFHDERPAVSLFRDYDALCKDVSMDFYAATIGPAVLHSTLVPIQELIGRRETVSDSFEALNEFCFGYYLFTHMIGPDPEQISKPPADPRATAADLQKARVYLEQAVGIIKPAFSEYVKGCQEVLKGFAVDQQVQAGIHSRQSSAEAARQLIDSGTRMKQQAEMELTAFEDGIRRRMTAALRLLHTPQLQQRLENAHELARHADQLAQAIEGMRSCLEPIEDLIRAHQGLSALLMNLKGRDQDERMITRVRAMRHEAFRSIEALHIRLKNTPYPFEHPNGRVNIGTVIIEVPPSRDDLSGIYHKGQSALEALDRLYARSLGTLARMALDVEAALGLPPIVPAQKITADE